LAIRLAKRVIRVCRRTSQYRLVYDALSPKDQEKWRIEWKRDAEAALG